MGREHVSLGEIPVQVPVLAGAQESSPLVITFNRDLPLGWLQEGCMPQFPRLPSPRGKVGLRSPCKVSVLVARDKMDLRPQLGIEYCISRIPV